MHYTQQNTVAQILGRPKGPFYLHKIKDIFFIFPNNFTDLDILSMSAISLRGRTLIVPDYCLDLIVISCSWFTRTCGVVQRGVSGTGLHKPLYTFDQPQRLLHARRKSLVLRFSCVFTFLEMMKHNMPEMLPIFFHLC